MSRSRLNRASIRGRAELIAHERGLPADEIRAAMKDDDAILDFAFRHKLSIDWLVCGDLRGRLRMAQKRFSATA